jgi:hypothetical protein
MSEQEVLVWLDSVIGDPNAYEHAKEAAIAARAMLARPVLPEKADPEALRAMANKHRGVLYLYQWEEAYAALYAHLTAPKTKEVEVWHCESAVRLEGRGWSPHISAHDTKQAAEESAAILANGSKPPEREFTCIRVTGPHKQTVPAS